MLDATGGRNAVNKFSPKHTAALALAAYLSYTSVMYIMMVCMTVILPNPIKARPIDGIIHEDLM